MIPQFRTHPELYNSDVRWKNGYNIVHHSHMNYALQRAKKKPLEIKFPEIPDIIIEQNLIIGKCVCADSIIAVQKDAICYEEAFVSMIAVGNIFKAPTGNIYADFIMAENSISLGPSCRVNIVKCPNGNIDIGRNSLVDVVIGNDITIHPRCRIAYVFATGIVRIPIGFPETRIIQSAKIEYL